ncbi:MAG: cbb3-type cytochrome oxidase assembly protein CcoS [Pseudomonadota bacterium]
MASLYLLIPVALVFCALVIKLLLWAIDSGQYDDLDRESWRILSDSDLDPQPTESHSRSKVEGSPKPEAAPIVQASDSAFTSGDQASQTDGA